MQQNETSHTRKLGFQIENKEEKSPVIGNIEHPGLGIVLKSCNLKSICTDESEKLCNLLVLLDLSVNDLTEKTINIDGENCYLRSLNISCNRFTTLPDAFLMKNLLFLDVSNNPIEHIQTKFFHSIPVLRFFHCENCLLSDPSFLLPPEPGKHTTAFMENLQIANNQFSDTSSIKEVLGGMRKLKTLTVYDNKGIEVNELEQLYHWISKTLTCLIEIDGEKVNTKLDTGKNLFSDTIERTIGNINVQDTSSCSCVHGNPCAVKYNCNDWDNRFEVVRRHREGKYNIMF
mmetsp:Transcript_6362/g.8036  ORF Transcript_6362/g.8036 Transcript_6362/m.8036 type:complete len:288 (+) Transcript_6362:358-1221(+)